MFLFFYKNDNIIIGDNMNGNINNDFVIENKFINNENNKKKKNKIIPIILLLLLICLLAFLVYQVKFAKKDSDRKSDEYSEYDPDYPLESDGHIKQEETQPITSNITETITSNVTSNITVTSNVVNSNKTSNVVNTSNNTNVGVTGVRLNESNISMLVGQTKNITYTITPSNAANKKVTFSSSNTSVATIDSNGKITAKAVGTTNITVKTKDGGKSATGKLTVVAKSIPVTGVKLNVSTLQIGYGGETSLDATITPSNATNKKVIWTSSNSKIVTVDSNGRIKGVNAGKATITATTQDGNKKASCVVNVSEKPILATAITITTGVRTVYIGKTLQLGVKYSPADANTKTKITWNSSDKSVATVNSNGLVTGVGEGDTTITAKTENGKSYSMSIYSRYSPSDYKVRIYLIDVIGGSASSGSKPTFKYTYTISSSINPSLREIKVSSIYYNGATMYMDNAYSSLKSLSEFCDTSKKATIYSQKYAISGVPVTCG